MPTKTIPPRRRGRRPRIDALEVLEALAAGESAPALARRLGVDHTTVYRARDRARLAVLTDLHKGTSASTPAGA
jgi:hypothetical protein